jgi:heme-degrading monooxygenase HmoA
MIARMWRGVVRTEKLAEYVDIVERTGMAGYRRTPGNQGAQLLTRDLSEGRSEVITLSWWADLDHIKAFAGDDIELAKYYPEDDEYLLDRETTVAHFEVVPPMQSPGPASSPSI